MNPCVLLPFLLFQPAGVASTPASHLKAVRAAGSIVLPVTIPKGTSVNNLFLRASSREEGIGIWLSGKQLTVISTHYAGRLTFLEEEPAFRITNLSLADGGTYEVSTQISSSEKKLDVFMVAVFNVTKTVDPLGNGSCSIDLHCEAGMGPRNKVTYSWEDRDTGTILAQYSWLHQIVHINKKMAYTCMAKIPTFKSTTNVVLEHPCVQSSAVPGRWVLGLAPLLAGRLLVAAAALLL